MKRDEPIICPYCNAIAVLTTGAVIYPHRTDFVDKQFWICVPCNAWVGCHDNTASPLGRLANAELRAWKSKAHFAFDPLWKRRFVYGRWTKRMARDAGYVWLAEQLGIKLINCHIGMFDVETCKRVVRICNATKRI